MKKKFLFLLVLMLSVVLISCAKEEVEPIYEDGYTYDETYHWIKSTNTDDIKDKQEHLFYNDVCVTCGYEYVEPQTELQKKYNALSISQAIKKANEVGENGTEEDYCVYGKIEKVSNATYGEMYITDGTNSIYVYGTYASDGVSYFTTLSPLPTAGDEIVVCGKIKTYNNSPEMGKSVIKEYIHVEKEVNVDDYTVMTVNEARSAESATLVNLTGVVATITYSNGMAPNGFYLIDSTGSIYVYGVEVSSQVKVGNTINIIGEKTFYLPDDATSASKFGYNGACQIQYATLVSNDNKVSDYDTSWIKESSVKEIIDTDYSENITSNIYKVTAIVKKSVGAGFINYYIDDLDDTTGSYVYTLNSGSDFSWLDEYDGKVCEILLSPLNVKVTATYCNYRFIPVSVKAIENYSFDKTLASEFAIKYYAIDQFASLYNSDPNLEVITKYSSELLGITDLTINYASSDENVIKFNTVDNVTYMNVVGNGKATVTISSTYADTLYTATVEINVEIVENVDYISVKEAIETEDGNVVQVKGVVASSVANQTAFYLVDDSGIIAVKLTQEALDTLSLGDEVVVKGTRTHYVASGNTTTQSVLLDSEIVVNYYGGKDYSTKSFTTDLTLDDLYAYGVDKDYSCIGYTFNCKIVRVNSKYASNTYLVNEACDKYILLYAASGSQYSWASAYYEINEQSSAYSITEQMIFDAAKNAKTVKVDMSICNWNYKKYNRGALLAVYNEDGTKTVNNTNFK